jgi:hypothetical protein
LGGIAVNYNSNFLQGQNDVVVIEADEFDRSFHRLVARYGGNYCSGYRPPGHLRFTKEKLTKHLLSSPIKFRKKVFWLLNQGQSINDNLPVLDKAFYSLHDDTSDVYCSKYWVVPMGVISST